MTLLDEVGLDVAEKAARRDARRLRRAPRARPISCAGMTADGRLGRKNGRGFYRYENGKRTGPGRFGLPARGRRQRCRTWTSPGCERRLVYAMLNEAALAEADGVIRSPRDGDIGAIFGIGFPPFRGGPLRMIDSVGAAQVVRTLRELGDAHGARFDPAPSLRGNGGRGGRYYQEP